MLLKSIPILCKKHEKQQQNVGLYMFSKIELIDFIFLFFICIQRFIILFCAANIKYINIIYSHVAWTEANSHLTTNKRAHSNFKYSNISNIQIYIEIDLKIDIRMRLCYNKKAQSLLWLLACMQWMDLKMLNTGTSQKMWISWKGQYFVSLISESEIHILYRFITQWVKYFKLLFLDIFMIMAYR